MYAHLPLYRTLLIAVLLLTAGSLSAQTPDYQLNYVGDTILFSQNSVRASDFSTSLSVTGPNDFSYDQTFSSTQLVEFNTLGLFDGQYNFEVRLLSPVQQRTDPATPDDRPKFTLPRHSGVFTIADTQLVSPSQDEPNTRTTITDNLIVSASGCFGLDCVDTESFGLDTLRVKENNTRIRFLDTSNSASFPSTDWQLTANEFTNGGANQFSIDDVDAGTSPFIVAGGAPNNALFINRDGKLGFGTRTPLVDMHTLNGNTPTLRLEQDGSGGFAAQAWDIGGNETEFFIRDNTNFRLPVRIEPGAPTDSLTIDTTGAVGLGTLNPAASLHLQETTVGPAFKLDNIGPNNREWDIGLLDSAGDFTIDDAATGVTELSLSANGDLTIAGSLITTRNTSLPKASSAGALNKNAGMSLANLSQFVAANQQLPGFAENAGAHDVVAFQMQLLQTIQQLTMHTIEQQQQIDALQNRLHELER